MEKITADDALSGDALGFSAAISGNSVILGAPYVHALNYGAAYVFKYSVDSVPEFSTYMYIAALLGAFGFIVFVSPKFSAASKK